MSLVKQLDTFKKRLNANSSLGIVESSKKRSSDIDSDKPKSKKPKTDSHRDVHRSHGSGFNANFLLLSKIVKHLKLRHQKRETQALTLDEILDEMKHADLEPRTKAWLEANALKTNLKIDCVGNDKYIYRPEYKIRGRKSLEALLDEHGRYGLGGILVEDIEESLANYNKILEIMKEKITRIQGADKKEIVFSKLPGLPYQVKESLQQIWKTTSVDGLDENRIREHLHHKNITSAKLHRSFAPKKEETKKKTMKKMKVKTDNLHLSGVLHEYD